MNLVQINERLKDLPMQVLQQYANGMNPEVPPYLALGELQRRETSQKQMATAQGGMQGPQSSVKEQVEQKAGLMALQQMQQQQAMQQMQQPRGPMPVPPGAPQPEAQPEPEMMARGGLASIPIRRDMFEYAGGGIITFAGGGDVDKILRKPPQERTAEENATLERSGIKLQRQQIPQDSAIRRADESIRQIGPGIREYFTEGASRLSDAELENQPAVGGAQNERILRALGISKSAPPPAPPSAPISRPTEQMTPQQMEAKMSSGLPEAIENIAPQAARKAATTSPIASSMPGAARPPSAAPAPAGLPAALSGAPSQVSIPVSPDRAELDALMREQRRQAPTAEGIKSDVSALMPAGMQEEALQKRFAEQRARAQAREDAYKASQPSGLENLIRVLGQSAQYKGLSGMAPAYTSMKQQQRAADLDFQRQQDELMTAIEGREYGVDKDVFSARTGAMDKAQTLFGESEKSILAAAAEKLKAEQGRLDKQTQLNMENDLERFKVAEEEKRLRMSLDMRKQEMKASGANNAAEYVSLMARSRLAREKGDIKTANELEAQAKNMMEWRGGSSGSGAANADKQELAELKTLLKNAEDTASNFALPKATREEAARRMSEINNQIASMTKLGSTSAVPSGKVPAAGTVMDGYKFKGGNPADKNNWEKV